MFFSLVLTKSKSFMICDDDPEVLDTEWFICRNWVLWKIGILWDEYQSGELSSAASQSGKCDSLQQCNQLVWDLLHHTIDWSLSCWCLLGKILDDCYFLNHLYFCKLLQTNSPSIHVHESLNWKWWWPGSCQAWVLKVLNVNINMVHCKFDTCINFLTASNFDFGHSLPFELLRKLLSFNFFQFTVSLQRKLHEKKLEDLVPLSQWVSNLSQVMIIFPISINLVAWYADLPRNVWRTPFFLVGDDTLDIKCFCPWTTAIMQ